MVVVLVVVLAGVALMVEVGLNHPAFMGLAGLVVVVVVVVLHQL